ncbi:MAG: hypothetical protein IT565_11320, partial [Rhodospirillales bacterium]|nr:hypothetical protein [Rhodospirillales bacterium]
MLAYLVVVPAALLIVSSLKPDGFPLTPGFTLANFAKVYGTRAFWSLLGNTAFFAIGSMLVALALGIVLAWL